MSEQEIARLKRLDLPGSQDSAICRSSVYMQVFCIAHDLSRKNVLLPDAAPQLRQDEGLARQVLGTDLGFQGVLR